MNGSFNVERNWNYCNVRYRIFITIFVSWKMLQFTIYSFPWNLSTKIMGHILKAILGNCLSENLPPGNYSWRINETAFKKGSNDPEKECGRNRTEWNSLKPSFNQIILNVLSWSYIPTWLPFIYDHLIMITIIFTFTLFLFGAKPDFGNLILVM